MNKIKIEQISICEAANYYRYTKIEENHLKLQNLLFYAQVYYLLIKILDFQNILKKK